MRTITRTFLALGLLLCSATLKAPAQTIPEWSEWTPAGPDYPSLDWRVRCWADSESQVKGTTVSWWDFEFRSRYTMTIDYVYQTRVGDASEHKNFWVGPFMGTLQSGQKSDPSHAVLIGPCIQHYSRGNGLWMDVKCVVPAGQDNPCLMDNGQRVQRLEPDELNQFGLSNPSHANNAGKRGGEKQVYFYCYDHADQDRFLVSKVFSKSMTESAVDQETETLNKEFSDWIKSSFQVTADASTCKPFNTREEASSAREDFVKSSEHSNQAKPFQAADWPPNGQP
jgi:hypothetical protein